MSTITASQEQSAVDRVPKQLFIAGEWRDGERGTFEVEDPSTAQSLCTVADASPADAMAALDAAVQAGPSFAATAPRERGEILRRAFETIIARRDELALLMTLEMGKSITESKAEITYAAEFFRWFSEEAVRIDGRFTTAANGAGRILTMKQPVGPCLLITPWNFPMAMGTRKIGPPSPPDARWWSSRPARRRCRCSRSRRSWRRPGSPPACSTCSPRPPPPRRAGR